MTAKSKKNTVSQVIGKLGEDAASEYLSKENYNIITRNFCTRYGEIDIIANNDKYIIFAEVKTRNQFAVSRPSEWVDIKKQKKIIMTASLYLQKNQTELQPRFDVIEIILSKENLKIISINHIENAFIQEGDYAVF